MSFIDESDVLTPADDELNIGKHAFRAPFGAIWARPCDASPRARRCCADSRVLAVVQEPRGEKIDIVP